MKLSSEVPGEKTKKQNEGLKKKFGMVKFPLFGVCRFSQEIFFSQLLLLSLPSVPEMRPCLRFPSALRGTEGSLDP